MIDFDGRSYTVDDATTNAYNILEYVNQFMIDNNVTRKDGSYVQFKISLASPIWLIILGIGYMATVCQKIMYAVAQAFNIGSCSDLQVLELAKVARLTRKQGSYTTIVTTVTAAATGACNITTDLKAKVTYEGNEYFFNPMENITIPASSSAEVILICTVTGPVFTEAGTITAFTTEVTNLGSISSSGSQPGSNIETIEELRTRLFNNEAVSPLTGVNQGLNALDGVTKAVVLFNSNYDSEMLIAGKTVPAKHALVIVQGYSTKLAETYFKYMSAQTYHDSYTRNMPYTLLNGQTFPFYYMPPISVNLYVRVHVPELITQEREAEIKHAVTNLSNSLVIGENYTQAYILDKIDAILNFPEITGCEVSIDGQNWSNTTNFNEGNIGLISADRITVKAANEVIDD